MTQSPLTHYADNSPEATLRVITLFIVSDGEVADAEMDAIERLGVLKTLGADQETFALVLDGYCDDLIAHAGTSRYVALSDADWVDAVLAPITDPELRRYLSASLLLIGQSDGRFSAAESSVYRQMLERWGLDIDTLVGEPDGAQP